MDFTVNIEVGDVDLNTAFDYHYDEDGDRVPGGTLADLLVRKLVEQAMKGDGYREDLKSRVATIRDEEIKAQIAPIIRDAIEKPWKKTNMYGEQTGAETTLREVIAQQTKELLSTSVEVRRTGGGTSYDKYLTKLVREQVDAALKAEIAETVKAVKEAVTAELGGSIADVVTSSVRDALAKRS